MSIHGLRLPVTSRYGLARSYNFSHALLTIIEEEGPIHQDVLVERVRELSNIGRVGSNISDNFDNAIKRVIKEGYVEKNKSDKGFLYPRSGKDDREHDRSSCQGTS